MEGKRETTTDERLDNAPSGCQRKQVVFEQLSYVAREQKERKNKDQGGRDSENVQEEAQIN